MTPWYRVAAAIDRVVTTVIQVTDGQAEEFWISRYWLYSLTVWSLRMFDERLMVKAKVFIV